MSDTTPRCAPAHTFDPHAPPNPAVTEQLREFGLTAREAMQFATVLAMASDAERLGLARLLAPSLVTGTATPPGVVAALVEALTECAHDLAEHIETHYGQSKDYTSMRAKYARDMEPTHKARAALAAYRGQA
jgi:hypothetical protein